jgi:hypothetical protein
MEAGRPSVSPDLKEGLALTAALLGCPRRNADADEWLQAETMRCIEGAKAAGASDAQAAEWAAVWRRLALCVIETSSW